MVRIKVILLVTFAVLCIAAASSAAALASEGEIVNAKGGHLIKSRFTGTGSETKLESAAKTKLICKSVSDHANFTSTTGGEVTVLFKECSADSFACTGGKDESGAAPSGSIYALLGLTVRSQSLTARLLLFTVHKPGTLEAGELEVTCAGIKFKIKGSFLQSKSTTVKNPSDTHNLAAEQSNGIQNVTEYENNKGEKVKCEGLFVSIEGGAFEHLGIENAINAKFEEEFEFL